MWLKSGGYIVINHTEALVAIDVNTGKFVGKGSNRLEDTIVRTNLEAVKEIVRQMRLRDLGGIIIIDFIDMEERRNREKVMAALEDALRADRAPSKMLRFNEFGLIAITRKRTKQALERTLCQPCPYCTGSGMVKSDSHAVLRNSDRSAQDGPGNRERQHHAARASGNLQGAQDARVLAHRGARALDQEERHHPGRSRRCTGSSTTFTDDPPRLGPTIAILSRQGGQTPGCLILCAVCEGWGLGAEALLPVRFAG